MRVFARLLWDHHLFISFRVQCTSRRQIKARGNLVHVDETGGLGMSWLTRQTNCFSTALTSSYRQVRTALERDVTRRKEIRNLLLKPCPQEFEVRKATESTTSCLFSVQLQTRDSRSRPKAVLDPSREFLFKVRVSLPSLSIEDALRYFLSSTGKMFLVFPYYSRR